MPHLTRILTELNKTANSSNDKKFIYYSDHSLVMIGMLNLLNITNFDCV
jgi:hypothetical protein